MFFALLLAVLLHGVLRFHLACASPCDAYTVLHDARRHLTHRATWSESLNCDSNLNTSEWNRFMGPAGDRLADNTSIPVAFECGTVGPIYLASRHPPDPDPNDKSQCNVSAPGNPYNLCARYGRSDCDAKFQIDIHQCCEYGETFFVYRLKTPITGCPLALCGTGKQQHFCPPGTTLKGNYCIPRFPTMLDQTKITGPHINGQDFTFECEIKPVVNNDTITDANYEVQFLFDGSYETNATGPANYTNGFKATLNQMDIEGKIGKRITCRAQGFWTGKPSGGGYIYSSNWYWAGIQVYQIENGNRKRVWAIHLDKTQMKPFEIELHSTLPILFGSHRDFVVNHFINSFPNLSPPPLKLQVNIRTSIGDFSINGGSGTVTCSVSLYGSDWNKSRDGATVSRTTITVVPIIDGKYDVNRNMRNRYLSFQTSDYFFPSIWKNYRIAVIPVYITDHQRQTCISWGGGTYVVTFDQAKFSMFGKGEYIMAQLETNFLLFEVRVKMEECYRPYRLACNCAVAAREGNDIFIVDKCNNQGMPRVWYRTAACGEVCPLPGNYIQTLENGNKYVIRFNSGASVTLSNIKRFMSVTINVPEYFKNMEMTGYCGNNDGRHSNDVINHSNPYSSPFLERNRIKNQGKSLFDPVVTPVKKTYADIFNETQRAYCHCQRVSLDENAVLCDGTKQFKDPEISGTADINLVKQILGRQRQRRTAPHSIYSDDVFENFGTDYNMLEVPHVESQVVLPQGMARKDAENYCYGVLRNSTIYHMCLTLDTFSINLTMSGCVEDLQVTGDKQFALNARKLMEETCINEANKIAPTPEELWDPLAKTPVTPAKSSDENLKTTTEANSPNPKGPSLAELSKSQACPSSCSGNGDCISGACACYNGYTSADCSIPVNKAPEILDLSGDGLCDVEVRPCLKTHLFVEPIYDSANFTCKVRKVKVDSNTGVRSSVSFETTRTLAELISFAEMICHLPREPIIPPTKDIAPVGNPVQGLLLSVSNDGVKFSEEVPLTIYDSVCIDCSKTDFKDISEEPVCRRKPGTCLINGYCYADGDPNPARPLCQHCDVRTSEDHFTNVTVTTQCDKCLGFPCFCDGKGWQCQCGAGYTIDTKTPGCVESGKR